MTAPPTKTECPEWYHNYIQLVPEGEILDILENQLLEYSNLVDNIPTQKHTFKYAEGKWTIKEILGHINDAERILVYRALRFARDDKTDIPQYDHDVYVEKAAFNTIPFKDLAEEFKHLRKSAILLFRNFENKTWEMEGTAGGAKFSVKAIAYIIVGHTAHHIKVLRNKYLKK
ncbi:DinB family protein [Bacteroidota bacterium]